MNNPAKPLSEYPDVIDLPTFAHWLQKSVGTIYNWRSRGTPLPVETLIGGKPHYRREHILAWLDGQAVTESRTGRKAVRS
ncbi:helix-turn-helix transcriptional regulator [Mariprofundus ferrooxydans]|uniref:helix-turn-helix transcriptional regulator n=1 Tax=Mariprofundus ferrooxydans TaxID=314344 RepID=UPI0014304D7C|nr:helix-turn-helix domain-containing protein [Mariprofundus ferrooxydans]